MKYLIVGEPRSGKTTFGHALAEALGTVATDTSTPLIDHLAEQRAAMKYNYFSVEEWRKQLHAHKEEIRSELVWLGNVICNARPSALIAACAEKGDVIVGPRRKAELFSWLRPRGLDSAEIIKIIRPGTTAPDNYELGDIERDLPVLQVMNDGSQDDLVAKARALAKTITNPGPPAAHGTTVKLIAL